MLHNPQVRKLIRLAIEEDLGFGDITSELLISSEHESRAKIIAREALVVCGLSLIEVVFEELHWPVEVKCNVCDGDEIERETVVADLFGKTRQLLGAERIILNFLQRLSGVATYTRAFVKMADGITVLDTRKTTPGWRVLEKYAVRIGGARNHRFGLGDMVLVKNNHIDACLKGSTTEKQRVEKLARVLETVRKHCPFYMPCEIEVRNIEELKVALKVKPEVVMLDNMTDAEIKTVLDLMRAEHAPVKIEVSGGITQERIEKLAALGVDCISVGALTRKASCVDLAMEIH